jgi:putative SOS response-associated peptidase YedK
VVRQGTGGRDLVLMQWGSAPWFSKNGKSSYSTINARAESVRTGASYREPFEKRRCLVPASGYFEWTGPTNDKQPYYFTRADGKPMAFAGLWDPWRGSNRSQTKQAFKIITTAPNKFAAQWRDRMPLILEPKMWDVWLQGDPDTAAALMKPANEDALISRPVNKVVGNVKNTGPELLQTPRSGQLL